MKRIIVASIVALLAMALPAQAAIVNGGFEGGPVGWTMANQAGGDGSFMQQTGAASPINGFAVPPPPGGSFAAMTDSQGPGSHVLYQDFVQSSAVTVAILSFDLYLGNLAEAFYVQNDLDFATPRLNQQARVDILAAGTDPFSLLIGDVLLNAYQSQVGDPILPGYFHVNIDITALLNANLNNTLRLRFAEVDNVAPFQLGVDNVAITVRDVVDVPEPATWLLLGGGVLGLALARRR